MYSGKRLGRAVVAVVAVAATAFAVGVTQQDAAAQPSAAAHGHHLRTGAPVFLEPGELPPHPASAWSAGPVTAGLPDYPAFCLEDGVLPERGASYREFWTELDTTARQLAFEARGTGEAKRLAARLSASVRDCAADFRERFPGAWADWRDYGTVSAADGARVYGVATAPPESEYGIALFGVGRSGRTVTVVEWSQMGGFADAPVPAFEATTATALAKLRP
ncbi:hypothetical protein SRB5_33430 [Streptomyces sp. RB5]|uniref:PknH-like extracellular domain-containing protein n=1 Tax=Streptomyces smaragdinus TaxID=2585196 RepID=A0A7K0CI88_9ACTN|nr:hypothetical protein [Streptomyces smaragdinus]MQY13200.1 hypothetical protein [Streptomyces smaragdinus]